MPELPDVHDPAARADAVARARRPVPTAVLDHLAATSTSDAQRRQVEALSTGAVAVVTGQQCGLFGGPLYTLHKAVAAIVNARALQEQTGVPCVPVFWIQDEDHDIDEIRRATLLGSDGTLWHAEVEADPARANCRVADQVLGPSIDAALNQLTGALGGLPHAEEVDRLFRSTHDPSTRWNEAFLAGMAPLFAAHGLLFLDAASPPLQPAAAPVHQRAIDQAGPLAATLQARADALEARGDRVLVHVRPDAPLSFVHPDGLDGPRYRAEPDPEGWQLVGTERVLSDAELRAGPHSTSALLRPILQDTWLPTACIVGGPGELAYLAQLPPLWPAFDLPVPLVAHRARFRLVDAPARKLLDRLDLHVDAACRARDDVLLALGSAGDGHTDPDDVAAHVTAGLDGLRAFAEEAAELDKNLGKSVRKTLDHLEHVAEKMSDRYRRTLARRDGVTTDRLDRLRVRLCPDDAPQERVLAWPTFGARVGPEALVAKLLQAAKPFESALIDVDL